MALTAEELRVVGLAMAAAFVAMGAAGFYPSWKRRRAEAGAVREKRAVALVIEVLWAAVQAVTIGGLAGALFAPGALLLNPFSFLAFTTLPVAFLGVAVFVAGAWLAGAAARLLGVQLTVAIETREGATLATSGPYARVRHPIYTGIFLMLSGLALAIAAPLVAAFVPVAIFCGTFRARLEEEMLASDPAFGAAYREYLTRTGRFLPRRAA